MDKCLFCAIARGDIPAHRVCETEDMIAFLDINPVRPGHTLIVPRRHYPYFDDMPPSIAGEMIAIGQKLAREMKSAYGAERVAFAFMGVHVPHAHAHVFPMIEPTDITSRRYIVEDQITFRMTPRAADAELAQEAARLRTALDL